MTTVFQIQGPAGTLELALEEITEAIVTHVMVICHPHPLFGGTMSNKVVTTLSKVASALHMPSIRFNFRGVGASTGEHDDGRGEVDDLRAVLAWTKDKWPLAKIILAGFSFGSYVAAAVAQTGEAILLISIAPPVMRWGFENINVMPCPWLVVQGDADEVVDAQAVFEWFKRYHPEAQVICFEKTTHFFHGQVLRLRETLLEKIPPYLVSEQ